MIGTLMNVGTAPQKINRSARKTRKAHAMTDDAVARVVLATTASAWGVMTPEQRRTMRGRP